LEERRGVFVWVRGGRREKRVRRKREWMEE
jgi:hypothetical protein